MHEMSKEAWEKATRHAGSHKGYRAAMEEHLTKMSDAFIKKVQALNLSDGVELGCVPSSGVSQMGDVSCSLVFTFAASLS